MSSITTAIAVDYRLQQWVQLVKECQNRPSDMTVEQWCDTKSISKSNYYYRLREPEDQSCMAGPRTDKYDISRGQYLKRAYTRRTEKAPARQL